MKKSTISLAIGLSLVSSAVFAGSFVPPPLYDWASTTSGSTSKNNTNAYAGLNWSMGGSWTPALVLGVFHTKVKSNGDTHGANLAFHVNLAGGINPGKLKLSYLNGKENIQGEIGAGYDLNGPFVAAGVDGYLSHGLVPYLTLQSQGKFSKPSYQTTTTCVVTPSGAYVDPACTIPNAPL